ncbi:MAG: type VI secretion system TssO [Bacteroidota bacterium]|jgi:hypothetical protein
MKPINQQERKSLFVQFLVLYLITITLIVVTMHFFYKVPKKELESLREQKEKFKSYDKGPREVLKKMGEADILLKQIKEGKDVSKSEADLSDICSQIKLLGDAKANPMDSIFLNIRNQYIDLLEATKKEKSSGLASATLGDITKELNDVKEKLRTCETQNEMLKFQVQSK